MDQTTRSQRSTLAGSQCASLPAPRCRLQKQVAKPRSRREAKAEGTIDPGQTQARGAAHDGREKARRTATLRSGEGPLREDGAQSADRRAVLPAIDQRCPHNGVLRRDGFGDTRVFFGVVLARGGFGVVVLTDLQAYPGESPEGARLLVEELPHLLDRMFGENARKPRTIFTDRGPGFYHRRWGTMTGEYEIALRRHGIKAWAGPNALRGPRAQPADVLLHETAISWLRRRREKTRPNMPWLETPAVFAARLERVVCGINAEYKVRELCLEFPERLRCLVEETHGDRLPK